jgi:predicted nucleic acid-binding protein
VTIDKVVVDASPLILLSKVDLANLLPKLFTEIVVPEAVWREIIGGGENDPTAQTLSSLRLKHVTVAAVPPEILVWNLGDGESDVLTFAAANQDYRAIVDDKAARSCARSVGINILGTGGLLILAKRRGLIESVATELQRLVQAGLWISAEMIDLLRKQAGESS